MTNLTINNTDTIQALKAMGADIHTRNNNHHVIFSFCGRKYEIAAKNNKHYQLNLLDYMNEDFCKELSYNENPLELLNRDFTATILR